MMDTYNAYFKYGGDNFFKIRVCRLDGNEADYLEADPLDSDIDESFLDEVLPNSMNQENVIEISSDEEVNTTNDSESNDNKDNPWTTTVIKSGASSRNAPVSVVYKFVSLVF